MTGRKRILTAILTAVVLVTSVNPVQAGIPTFPDVTGKMTVSTYWSDRKAGTDKILASRKMIGKLNKVLLSDSNTNLADLKKLPETVDGKALNEALYKAATADAAYYGSKYDAQGNQVSENYYTAVIANTQGSDVSVHEVKYGVAVNRTTIRVFPTDLAILDDPGDNDFDNLYNSGLRVNEPFVIQAVSADGKFYYGRNDCCSGWVPAEDVAVCNSRDEWLDAWDHDSSEVLVVYGSKIKTEDSNTAPETANRLLTMGTTLELADDLDNFELISNRSAYYNYAVYLPVRKSDGSFVKKPALISANAKVHEGFLDLTEENIMAVSFEMLGDAYGWGGMLNSDDCSGYVRDVYRCFGLNLARNTSWQSASPVKKYDLTGYSDGQKLAIIENLPIGSTLFFPGHEMTYLGAVKGKIYVISSTSSMMNPLKDGERLRVRGVVINTLDVKRANGKTWLESLSTATIPFAGAENKLYDKSFVGEGFSDAMKVTEFSKSSRSGKKLKLEWEPAEEGTYIEGYKIQYAFDEDFSGAKEIDVEDGNASSYNIKTAKKSGDVYVRICNYTTVDGTRYFSGWSQTVKL